MYNIFSPSYKRAEICKTHKYLPSIIYVVSKSEAEAYSLIHDKIWVIPDEVQGNLARVWNYILDNATGDHIITIDDDLKYFGRWNCNVEKKLNTEEAHNMITEGIQLAIDLNVKYWGLNCISDKGAYREYTPFAMTSYIGGPFQAHNANPLRYDEKIFLKEDYDMTLQVLKKYRKNLRLNMYHYVCEQATIKGGCAAYRNVEVERKQFFLLQKKWGKDIITRDRKSKRSFDFNPILKVPIKGV